MAPWSRRSTQSPQKTQNPQTKPFFLRVLRIPRVLRYVATAACAAATVSAHDFERTQVTLSFAADGAFVLDVANDGAWLQHRLIPFAGEGHPAASAPEALRRAAPEPDGGLPSFADRVVLFVDGREIRPASVEYIPGDPVGIYRMRGRMPLDAQSLRWYYGLPMDPYPLTVRRADGRIIVEEIAGDAWSRPIDLAGQFRAPRFNGRLAGVAIAALLLAPLAIRLTTKITKTRKSRSNLFFFVCFVISCVSWQIYCCVAPAAASTNF